MNRSHSHISPWIHSLTNSIRLYHLLLIAWILTMICVPIARWNWGDYGLRLGVMAGVLLQACTVIAVLQDAWGWRRVAVLAATILPVAWAIEWIGSSTGIPFGSYHYTNILAPQLLGVPLLIPLAWLMMLPPAWAVAAAATGQRPMPATSFILVSALAFTAWDLFLDPQMVAWGYWIWEPPGAYFGIPAVNFVGWLLSAALITIIVRPRQLPILPLMLIYTITWALQTVGQMAFWQMPGPALAGFVGMGTFVGLAWWTMVLNRSGER